MSEIGNFQHGFSACTGYTMFFCARVTSGEIENSIFGCFSYHLVLCTLLIVSDEFDLCFYRGPRAYV